MIAVSIGCIDLTCRTDDGFTCAAVNALHIALTDQKQQGYGGSRDFHIIFRAVYAHFCRAGTGGDQLIVCKGQNRRIGHGVFFHPIANLIGRGHSGIEDLHCFSAYVQMVVVILQSFQFRRGSTHCQSRQSRSKHQDLF